ncbi:MAG: ABC transporter permease [Candidatus Lambdaproteobacteria bacterium]|nr:ABC transporter permease [Candidatus Lambdaproteobacteria bacterium]
MPIAWAISLRYLRSARGGGALSFITWVSVLGVGLGVAALVVAMAVMNGYQANLVRAMAGALPHLSLLSQAKDASATRTEMEALVRKELDVAGFSPFVMDELLVRAPGQAKETIQGIMLRGIDPQAEGNWREFLAFFDGGTSDWTQLAPAERERRAAALLQGLQGHDDGDVPILLSHILARKLGVAVGDRLTPLRLPAPGEGFSPAPMSRRLRVLGYIDTGIVTFDELVVVADLAQARALLPAPGAVDSLGVRLVRPLEALQAAQRMRNAIALRDVSGWYVYSWMESNAGLFQVIRLQKSMLFLILMLIVVIAFFGMVSALIMLVVEKGKEIAVLRALGLAARHIHRVFLLQGVLIGLIGTLAGLALGLAICWALATFPVIDIPPGVYPGSDTLPVAVSPWDVALVVGGSLLVCVAATAFPARKAMRMPPVQGLRFR